MAATSSVVLPAKTSVRSPRQLFMFINDRIQVYQKYLYNFENKITAKNQNYEQSLIEFSLCIGHVTRKSLAGTLFTLIANVFLVYSIQACLKVTFNCDVVFTAKYLKKMSRVRQREKVWPVISFSDGYPSMRPKKRSLPGNPNR